MPKAHKPLVIGFIVMMTVASSGLAVWAMRENTRNASMINEAGKRRYLSQRISFWAIQLMDDRPEIEKSQIRKQLLLDIAQLERVHQGLAEQRSPSLVAADKPYALSPDRNTFPYIDFLLKDFLETSRAWAKLPTAQMRRDHPTLEKILRLGPNDLLQELDRAVTLHENRAVERMRLIIGVEVGTTALLLLALFFF